MANESGDLVAYHEAKADEHWNQSDRARSRVAAQAHISAAIAHGQASYEHAKARCGQAEARRAAEATSTAKSASAIAEAFDS